MTCSCHQETKGGPKQKAKAVRTAGTLPTTVAVWMPRGPETEGKSRQNSWNIAADRCCMKAESPRNRRQKLSERPEHRRQKGGEHIGDPDTDVPDQVDAHAEDEHGSDKREVIEHLRREIRAYAVRE